MAKRSEVIQAFLKKHGKDQLKRIYEPGLEVQVEVAQDGGELEIKDFNGRKVRIYRDETTSWCRFRIPKKAKTDNPEDNDCELKFDFETHVDSIGLTGWDYKNKVSKWVGFDFDSIAGHIKEGLTPDELEDIQKEVSALDWVTIQRSTSGNGLHLYVFLPEVPCNNHTEHAALARAILSMMSACVGKDFSRTVDVCGQVLWVWSRRGCEKRSFELIKQGRCMFSSEVPSNWREHINVVKGTSNRLKLQGLPEEEIQTVEQLMGQYPRTPLDKEHKTLMKYLQDNKMVWWWDPDLYMLVTHTVHLKKAKDELGLKGVFETNSSQSSEQNCFCFPLAKGGWVVRRYSKGVKEHISWDLDTAGWTRAYLNRPVTLETAVRIAEGQEHPKGGYYFPTAENLLQAITVLGLAINLPPKASMRQCRLLVNKQGKVVIEMPRENMDDPADMRGWIAETKKFIQVVGELKPEVIKDEMLTADYDDFLRHLISVNHENAGWVIRVEDNWRSEPLQHVNILLRSKGLSAVEADEVLGQCISKAWKLVNMPFKEEYPGNRQWNRDAAKLKYPIDNTKTDLKFNTWRRILDHCGKGLDNAVKASDYCKEYNILTGGDYLMLWCASLFQFPHRSLPYLFFYGDQTTGKSTFHESLALLFSKGYTMANNALTSSSGFNGELEGAILCVVEEVDLSISKTVAYNRMKQWVTNKDMLIQPKGKDSYLVNNISHWVQCANDFSYCPIFPDDSRITVIETFQLPPTSQIPRYELIPLLQKEATDFISYLFQMEVPQIKTRLSIPILSTSEKESIQSKNESLLMGFISEECEECQGAILQFSVFYERFQKWLDSSDRHFWRKNKVSRDLPPHFPSGGIAKFSNQKYIGNIKFKGSDQMPKNYKIIYRNGQLFEAKVEQ